MPYLFTHFTIDGKNDIEKIFFSVSKDGLNWIDLGGNTPLLSSDIGTKGIRDPFPIYDERTKKYYILGTDLETSDKLVWNYCSKRGSRDILIWESDDLIHWSDVRAVTLATEESGNLWAPEAVFCKEQNKWLVFWASNIKQGLFKKRRQIIFASFTEDFVNFEKPFKFLERKTSVIDTTIVFSDGFYYRFSKDETNKKIIIDRCPTLLETSKNKYTPVKSSAFEAYYGLEGPEVYYLQEQMQWVVIADDYHKRKGYIPFVSKDFASDDFVQLKEQEYDFGKRLKRHGGILEISEEKYNQLINELGI